MTDDAETPGKRAAKPRANSRASTPETSRSKSPAKQAAKSAGKLAGDPAGSPAVGVESDPRRRRLLEAALTVFTRYGFRKSSMDEVARAAQVSRQGLYLHFATKEEIFRAGLHYALESGLNAAVACLDAEEEPLESRLVQAFDQWIGRYIGMMGAGAADLAEASNELADSAMTRYENRFLESVARTIRTSHLLAAYKPAGLTARQLADTLNATARGLKHSCATRADFVVGFTLAVRAMCLPLRGVP